ncbi:polyribonucleotide nucleotidyltransferase [Hugenholtzia roseola]|uniref:polyribonucleotide nucleotidyltransferase n=1 Tax=Hugenholtzia roseola TaxID=1002 RepID=UPI000419F3C2|nr:polyribonucleotide nucleotidyltransferase [Hugenholtzia roseola]
MQSHSHIPTPIVEEISLPDGRIITLETGKLAKQADGAIVLRLGKTMLLATAVANKDLREDQDFFPLSVDYQEKFASAGRIPGGFLKREGRLSEQEILISRLVDRALRPLFPDDFLCETQILITLISSDKDTPADALAGLAASAALAVSNIPFPDPISEVRVIQDAKGDYLVNPNLSQMEGARLDLIVAATEENIMMVEGESKEVSETELLEALKVVHQAIQVQCRAQKALAQKVGKQTREYAKPNEDLDLRQQLFDAYYDSIYQMHKEGINRKKDERSSTFKAIKESYIASLPEDHSVNLKLVSKYFGEINKKAARNLVLNEGLRLDGRNTRQIRPIWSEVDYLPAAHGSAVFTRGETQSLTTVTLGTKLDEQLLDSATQTSTSKFMLHYNFPPFSTGEAKPIRGVGRREVGHGNLAHRALKQVLPAESENPYTIRVVSDILESNGSSSMATVCAGSLALMDAGVPVKAAVSGIAMGMISDPETKKYAILSDILGDEDHLGDMDFKITGTAQGITACQMDIKVDGLSYEVLNEALLQAKEGRLHILGEMNKTLEEPRTDLKDHAPRSAKFDVPRDMIGAIIGQGGKVIQEIQRETATTIVIEEIDGKGVVSIFSVNKDGLQRAYETVQEIISEPEIGKVYQGKVKGITEFGAFVEFMRGKEGLLHISEISWERIASMEGIFKEGEILEVKLIEVDERTGKFRLSRKALLEKPEGYVERPRTPQTGSRDAGRRQGGGGNFNRRR